MIRKNSYTSKFLASHGMEDIISLRLRELQISRDMLQSRSSSLSDELREYLSEKNARSVHDVDLHVLMQDHDLRSKIEDINGLVRDHANSNAHLKTELRDRYARLMLLRDNVLSPLYDHFLEKTVAERKAEVKRHEAKAEEAVRNATRLKDEIRRTVRAMHRLHEEVIQGAQKAELSQSSLTVQRLEADLAVSMAIMQRISMTDLATPYKPEAETVNQLQHSSVSQVTGAGVAQRLNPVNDATVTDASSSSLLQSSFGPAGLGDKTSSKIDVLFHEFAADASQGLTRQRFLIFCLQSGLLQDPLPSVTIHDCDRIFDSYANGAFLTLQGFGAALNAITKRRPLRVTDLSQTLSRAVLSLSLVSKPKKFDPVLESFLLMPANMDVLNSYEAMLQEIYSDFGPKMNSAGFLQFCTSFGIVPALMADTAALKVFRATTGRETISYSEFVASLGRLVVERHGGDVSKVMADGRIRLERFLLFLQQHRSATRRSHSSQATSVSAL